MSKLKVIHTLYSGLGGHSAVVFPMLESAFSKSLENLLIFYGVEPVADSTLEYVEKIGINTFYIPKKRWQYRKPFRRFKHLLETHQPQGIIVHNSELLLPALSYSKRNKDCTVVYVEHQDQDKKGFVLRKLSKKAAQKANAVVCLNPTSREQLLQKYTYECPLKVIPNGINTSVFLPKKDSTSEIRTFGMASRMVEGKDHETLLKSFALALQSFPDLNLKIAGDGPTLNKHKAFAKNLKIDQSVTFLGRLDEKEMPKFYHEIDVYIQATFAETLCTSILQAMATKTPVIASDIPNNRSLMNQGDFGWLYENKNTQDLISKIEVVINDRSATNKHVENGYIEIQSKYTHDQMTKQYIQLINGTFKFN